ncbi:MAG: hypothetical protein O7G84_15155 [Gammaproteobacteria bacterium]|nr:hypothetical protein [Gammaproteobacteria bacterium]
MRRGGEGRDGDVSVLEFYRAAQATISRYGDDTALHAAQRADELLAAGDMEGRRVWHRIERAIDELRRTAPGQGEGVH